MKIELDRQGDRGDISFELSKAFRQDFSFQLNKSWLQGSELRCFDDFCRSVEQMSQYTSSSTLRSYLVEVLATGSFQITSPWNGQNLTTGSTLLLADKTCLVSFEQAPSLFLVISNLGLGYPICAAIFLSIETVYQFQSDIWGLRPEHLTQFADVIEKKNWSPGRATSSLSIITGDANYAHNAWNQLGCLEQIVANRLTSGSVRLISTHNPFAPTEELYPELSNWLHTAIPDYELATLNEPGGLFLPVGSRWISGAVKTRIVRDAGRRDLSPAVLDLRNQLRRRQGLSIWLSIRTRNRTATNLLCALAEICVAILRSYPNARITVDGHSLPNDFRENPSYAKDEVAAIVREDRAFYESLLASLSTRNVDLTQIASAIGCSIGESILLAQEVDFYFCHHGTVQHKIGWFTSAPGLVHGNTMILADGPAEWVANQYQWAFKPQYVPAALIEDKPDQDQSVRQSELQVALKTDNYRFVNIPRLVELFIECVNSAHPPGILQTRQAPYSCSAGELSKADRKLIASCGIVDEDFYSFAYPDVKAAGCSALQHYISFGIFEGRRPSASVDPFDILASLPEFKTLEAAMLSYICRQLEEGRVCGADRAYGAECVAHAVAIKSSGLLDAKYYQAQLAFARPEMDAAMGFVLYGGEGGFNSKEELDWARYLELNADLRDAKVNPLIHWIYYGRAEGRELGDGRSKDEWQIRSGEPISRVFDAKVRRAISAAEAYFEGTYLNRSENPARELLRRATFSLAQKEPMWRRQQRPDISIIIPVYGQTKYVLACLESLRRQVTGYSVEVILCNDKSPDEAGVGLLSAIPWIRYIERPVNGGFIRCCNSAALHARGDYIVFLNSDVWVVQNWLDELIDSFAAFGSIGIVGSALVNSDGSLQESGGLFWNDGEAWNYGRGQSLSLSAYAFARQVDYVSGASLAVRKDVWEQLGGFDEEFLPAYCEDADLCFRARMAGFGVIVQPNSVVIHFEGKTHGTDTSQGVKSYQTQNLKRFRRRYELELAQHIAPGSSPEAAANRIRDRQISILVIDALTPAPDRDAGSVMTDGMIAAFQGLGYAVDFFAAHNPHHAGDYTKALQRRGVYCHFSPQAWSIEDVVRRYKSYDYVLIYRYNVVSMVLKEVRRAQPTARVIFCDADLHHVRERRAALNHGSQRQLIASEVTRREELKAFVLADASIVHTQVEVEMVNEAMPSALANIVVLPWIINSRKLVPPIDSRADVMFLGNFGHTPNIDAAIFLVTEIWPKIEPFLPLNVRLLIVGNAPPAEVLALASGRVIVTGHVPDLDPYFDSARVFVAPLRYGAGIKGKVVSALAAGVPSVVSSVGVEGIGLSDQLNVSVADDSLTFARSVVDLYKSHERWYSMQAEGWAFVDRQFSEASARETCSGVLALADEVWVRRSRAKTLREIEHILLDQADSHSAPRLRSKL